MNFVIDFVPEAGDLRLVFKTSHALEPRKEGLMGKGSNASHDELL